MLRCSKCPGSYGAVFCGMVQLGPRTCGFKQGEMYLLLISSVAFRNELRVVIPDGCFCADMRLYLDTVLRAAWRTNVDRVSLVPPLSLVWPLCTQSGMLVYFGEHVVSEARNCIPKSQLQVAHWADFSATWLQSGCYSAYCFSQTSFHSPADVKHNVTSTKPATFFFFYSWNHLRSLTHFYRKPTFV